MRYRSDYFVSDYNICSLPNKVRLKKSQTLFSSFAQITHNCYCIADLHPASVDDGHY